MFKKFAITLLFFFTSTISFASFHKNFWPIWVVNNPLSTEVISHKAWQNFLDHHLVINNEGIALIDYRHLRAKHLYELNDYVNYLSKIPIDNYNRQEQLAYWINLYNALTVQIISRHHPISNIQDINISPGLFSVGPWGANLVQVQGVPLSLDDIQNRIIRPIWNDARTHYAVNNGSLGAPNLSKKAFSSENLEAQLNEAAGIYINSLRGVQVIEGKLVLSKLYTWYEEDFGGTDANIINHLSLFAREPLKSQLKNIHEIDNYMYNWHLNIPPPPDF